MPADLDRAIAASTSCRKCIYVRSVWSSQNIAAIFYESGGGMFEQRWYLCKLTDRSELVEPDWSRVPEARRESVRSAWLDKQLPKAEPVHLWGPQIAFFASLPYYRVEVSP